MKPQRRRLEQRVRERTQELEQNTAQLAYQAKLLDLANDAIFIRTADDKISYWNEGAERLYGWAREEASAGQSTKLFTLSFQFLFGNHAADRWEGELRQQRRDGNQVTVSSRWTTLRDRERQSHGLAGN